MPRYEGLERIQLIMWYMYHAPKDTKHTSDTIAAALKIPSASIRKAMYTEYRYVFTNDPITKGKMLSHTYPDGYEFDMEPPFPAWAAWKLEEALPHLTEHDLFESKDDKVKGDYFTKGLDFLQRDAIIKLIEYGIHKEDNREPTKKEYDERYNGYNAGLVLLRASRSRSFEDALKRLVSDISDDDLKYLINIYKREKDK